MNNCFQSVFTRKSQFKEESDGIKDGTLEGIKVDTQKVMSQI